MLVFCLLSLYTVVAATTQTVERNETNSVTCNENGDCPTSAAECHKVCGCDRSEFIAIYYNETTKSCVVSFKHLMISQLKIYGEDDEETESTPVDTMAEKIRIEAEAIFNTILVSVILFLTCCAICFISACYYCCRMNYTDYTLKKDIKALANKLKRDNIQYKKASQKRPQPRQPASESCNVVCEDAGVFVV